MEIKFFWLFGKILEYNTNVQLSSLRTNLCCLQRQQHYQLPIYEIKNYKSNYATCDIMFDHIGHNLLRFTFNILLILYVNN